MRRKWIIVIAVAVPLSLAALAAGNSLQENVATCPLSTAARLPGCPGHLEFEAGGAIVPIKLPAHKMAPVGLEVHGKISMSGGDHPDAMREAIVDVAEDVEIDAAGLPACDRQSLEHRGVTSARRLCRKAIVGSGVAHIGFASSDAVIEAPLTLFNGGSSRGETRLFVHSAIFVPGLISLVTAVKIRKMRSGLQMIWKLPPILEGDGSLLDFKFKVGRRFMNKEEEHTYLAARCPRGDLQASVPKTVFRNEARTPGLPATTTLKGLISAPCSPT